MFFNYSKTKQKKYKKFISSNRLEKNKLSDKLGKLINDGGLIVQRL